MSFFAVDRGKAGHECVQASKAGTYVAWLEAGATNHGGKTDEEAMKALRRGWYISKPNFAQRLMALFEKKNRKKNRTNGVHESH